MQRLEKRRNVTQIGDRRRRVAVRGRRRFLHEEDVLGAAASAQADLIAVAELLLGDLRIVDERHVPRLEILNVEGFVLAQDEGVIARHLGPLQPEIIGLAPSKRELGLVDRHDSAAQPVGYFESRVGHESFLAPAIDWRS